MPFYFVSPGLVPGQSMRNLWWMRGHSGMFSLGTSFSTIRFIPWMLHTHISFTYYLRYITLATDSIVKQQATGAFLQPFVFKKLQSII